MTDRFANPASSNMDKNTDFFADIATAHFGSPREPLFVPAPALVPDVVLPLTKPALYERRPRHAKITSQAGVTSALAELRERYTPVLQDLAPALPTVREQFSVANFDWRIETPADRSAFAAVLAGAGLWEKVSIPHYGPPLGRASTLYRAEIELPAVTAGENVLRLCFGGVDYKCQVYLNGLCIGTHEGFFEEFWFDCTGAVLPGKNTLLVRVENDYSMLGETENGIKIDGDKLYAATGLGYDDPELGWHHCPPAMGIWNYVRFEKLPRLFIDDLWVRPLVESGEIEIHAEIESRSATVEEDVSLRVSVFGQNFEALVHRDHIHRGEAKFVRGYGDLVHGFDDVLPSLMGFGRNYLKFRLPMPDARVWSPETPWLYQAQVHLLDRDGASLDTAKTQFGMRSFIQDENSSPKGKFYLNGNEIRLRGANTMGNFERCIMQGDFGQLRDDILLAKLTNMNFLRMTQRPVHREFYDYCDRLGMMVQTDLPMFSTIRRNLFCSSILVSFINEPRPVAASKPHRFLYRDEMENLFDMAARCVRQQNPGRVVKYVDGDYDPPAGAGMPDNHVYCGWYIGQGIDLGALHKGKWLAVKPGWHFGCGEFGAEGLDSFEVMTSEYPESWKPASFDASWSPSVISMSQSWNFHFLWYDTAKTARGWIESSQEFQAWTTGLMTRAYRSMAGMNSFAIHLFIDAWPAGWMKTIMDVHRIPKKAWFTYRDALTPTAVFLRTDRAQLWAGEPVPVEIWVCNDRPMAMEGCSLWYEVTHEGRLLAVGQTPANIPACAPCCQGRLPVVAPPVEARSRFQVGISLLDTHGSVRHDHGLELDVFPVQQTSNPAIVWCPDASPEIRQFIDRLGLVFTETFDPSVEVILFSDPHVYQRHCATIDRAVRAGAVAVALGLPPGVHSFGAAKITVREASMGPRHFVSRATGHPLVAGFEPNDFRFWFHESLGRVAPILFTVLEAPGWTPVLLSGDGGWTRPWDYNPAAAEIAEGEGLWRVCQIEQADCIQRNPQAKRFASRLLSPIARPNAPERSRLGATGGCAARPMLAVLKEAS